MISKYNYYNLNNIKPKFYLLGMLLILLIIVLIIILNCKIYDSSTYYAVYQDGYLNINVMLDDTDTIIKGEYLKIENDKYNYNINKISELLVDNINYVNYQQFQIDIDKDFLENEIIKIIFLGNKQRIINKIWHVIV